MPGVWRGTHTWLAVLHLSLVGRGPCMPSAHNYKATVAAVISVPATAIDAVAA